MSRTPNPAALALAAALAAAVAFSQEPTAPGPAVIHPDETHFANLRQLTFGGQNAEGYWSPDGTRIIYQRMNEDESVMCDQEYVLDLATGESRRVSTGKGRVTCGYFYDGGGRILYASTHLADPDCPPPVDHSKGYAWPMIPTYDVVTARADGTDVRRLTETPGYDAEATVSPDGRTIVFTSLRAGDLEIYSMDVDGTNVRRLTHEPGYDGGHSSRPTGSGSCTGATPIPTRRAWPATESSWPRTSTGPASSRSG